LVFSLPLLQVADKRVALVIGNSAYQHVAKLPNPAKDAASMGDMLKQAGFDVVDAKEDVRDACAFVARLVRCVLDEVEPTNPNTVIAFASKAGSTASDGDGKSRRKQSASLPR
jgi:uncharacterized caspase-like protein